MEIYEREYFLSRIISGYTKYKKDDLELKIYSPTPELNYEANEVYMEVYNNCLEEGIMTDDDVYNLLLNEGLWTEEDEKNLTETLPEHIKYFQKELFKAAFKSNLRTKLRKYLKTARDEQERLHDIKHQFDAYTCHGTANFARYQYIIESSTYKYDGTLYDWANIPISNVIQYHNENTVLPEMIREISRTMPWHNTWQACKSNGQVFPKSGVELSMPQQLLLMWSKMYDDISDSPDCPHESIVEDDDMLDGWILIQKEKRDSEKNKKIGEEFTQNEKIANAQEIYLVAETLEDAKKIDDMNDPRQKAIKRSRLKHVKEKGQVKHQEFKDVQQMRKMQLTEQYNNKFRKGNG